MSAADLDLPALLALATEARELSDRATEGPWETDDDGDIWGRAGTLLVCHPYGAEALPHELGDASFLVHARTAVPALADAVAALVEEVQRLRGALVSLRDAEDFDWDDQQRFIRAALEAKP